MRTGRPGIEDKCLSDIYSTINGVGIKVCELDLTLQTGWAQIGKRWQGELNTAFTKGLGLGHCQAERARGFVFFYFIFLSSFFLKKLYISEGYLTSGENVQHHYGIMGKRWSTAWLMERNVFFRQEFYSLLKAVGRRIVRWRGDGARPAFLAACYPTFFLSAI